MAEWAQFRIDASKHIARKSGQSAVAAAAYRSGENLVDERTGEVHDYTRRFGVLHAEVVMPDAGGPEWTRQELWNAAEAAEKRKDGRTARKIEMALPSDMTDAQRLELSRAWAGELANRYGVAVDFAIHLPDKEGDQRNHHVHMMMTTRRIDRDGLSEKAHLELSNTDQKARGLAVGDAAIRELRHAMAERFNRECARMGVPLSADARSYAERGIELVPTKHVGVHATNMQRRGVASERSAEQEAIRQDNAERIRQRPEVALERLAQQRGGFTVTDMAKELNRYIDDAQEFQSLLARLQQSPEIVKVANDQQGNSTQSREARYATKDREQRAARAEERARAADDLRSRWEAYRAEFYEGRKKAKPVEQAETKARYREITETARNERADVRASGLTASEKKARLSLIAADAVQKRERLRLEQSEQRPKLDKWPDWVRDRAQEGDAAAMSKVRGWAYRDRRLNREVQRKEQSEENAITMLGRRRVEPMAPRQALASAALEMAASVDRRTGDVAYRIADKQAFIDRGKALTDVRQDAKVMEAALKLAAQKFGPVLQIKGNAEFRQLAVETAVRQGLNVTFQDAAMQAQAEALRKQLQAERAQQQRPAGQAPAGGAVKQEAAPEKKGPPTQEAPEKLASMSSRELRELAESKRPPEPRKVAQAEPAIVELRAKQEAAQVAAREAAQARLQAQAEAEAWRKAHGVRAGLHDKGLRTAPELVRLQQLATDSQVINQTKETEAAALAKEINKAEAQAIERIKKEQAPQLETVKALRAMADKRELAAEVAAHKVEEIREMINAHAKGKAGWESNGAKLLEQSESVQKMIKQLASLPADQRERSLSALEKNFRERGEQNPGNLAKQAEKMEQQRDRGPELG